MTLTPDQQVRTWQVASLLLGYPDEALLDQRPLLRAADDGLPRAVAGALGAFLDHLDATPLPRLATDYVATFDLRRRCCLYLTYYAYGDTRKRGLALLRFAHAFRAAGLVLADGELPDHLAVVLEFAATGDRAAGLRLLQEHRGGIEVLRRALRDAGSAYTSVLDAVSGSLPPLGGDEELAVRRLVAAGPPAEEVGLESFAPPDYLGARR